MAEARKLYESIDINIDGVLTRDEVLKKSLECLNMSADEAGALFDSLDLDKSGHLEIKKIENQNLVGFYALQYSSTGGNIYQAPQPTRFRNFSFMD